ncbi:MAG: hypothetical protein K2L14_09780 [Duncaniella sp.]|nr:hypothetical protein [Duncaniella sp.]
MDLSTYEIIRCAYRSRLLHRTEAGYRATVGVSFETIRDRRDDEAAMVTYYDMLDRECRNQCGESLRAMVTDYLRASAACAGEAFDWQQRRQLASRKKFCRWLFRRVSAPGKKIEEEESRYSKRDCDEALKAAFYPDGIEGDRVYDLIFVMLITFGIIRPCDRSASRSRDVSEADAMESFHKLADLVGLLRDDTPQMGVLPKPQVFDIALSILSGDMKELVADWSVARIWEMLSRIENACVTVSSPQKTADAGVNPVGYIMPGIWIDDADGGKSRFWIFPENKIMAFCYECIGGYEWVMRPYEFVFYQRTGEQEFEDFCVITTARGNEQIIEQGGVMDPDQMVTASYTLGRNNGFTYFGKISFTPLTVDAPSWMNWHSFRRLRPGSELHTRYSSLIADLYNPASPLSRFFRNAAPFLTDELNALVAIDNDYIYLSDLQMPDRYEMRCDVANDERYWYEPVYRTAPKGTNLRDIEISEEHPLYILPRFADRFKSDRHRRFAEACRNTDIGSQITIYHTGSNPRRVLCFNNFSIVFPLTDDYAELLGYGVERITRRSDLLR